MRVWGKILIDQHIDKQVVREFSSARPVDAAGWTPIIHELCQELDLARPVLLQKHFHDLNHFGRVVFKHSDFPESVNFDRFEIELFPEKKKEHESFIRYA